MSTSSCRHKSVRGVPFSPAVAAFLDAAAIRYRHLSSFVWVTPHAMKELGLQFTTPSPTMVPLETSPQKAVTANGSGGMPCVVFNASETTWVDGVTNDRLGKAGTPSPASGLLLPQPCSAVPLPPFTAVNAFDRPWSNAVQHQLARHGSGDGTSSVWVTPAQSHALFGIPWTVGELQGAMELGAAVYVTLSPSHVFQTELLHIPTMHRDGHTLVLEGTATSASSPLQSEVLRKLHSIGEYVRQPWVRFPLAPSCNAYGQRYAQSTATLLRRHWIGSLLHPERRERSRRGGLEWKESLVARAQQCLADEKLSGVLHRWATPAALSACGLQPLPGVTCVSVALDNLAPVELYNLALTDIALDPTLVKCHPLMADNLSSSRFNTDRMSSCSANGAQEQMLTIQSDKDDDVEYQFYCHL